LKVRVDTEEVPVWALKISESGLKIKPAEQGCFQIPRLKPGSLADEAIMRQLEEARGAKPFCRQTAQSVPPNIGLRLLGTMSQLAEMLSSQAGYGSPLRTLATTLDARLVLNKTAIPDTDVFDIAAEYGADAEAWVESSS
jgi:hypothetical protein